MQSECERIPKLAVTKPFNLYVGIITGDPEMLEPLLDSLLVLEINYIASLYVVVLSNGCVETELDVVIARARNNKLKVAVISERQQHSDAENGGFGHTLLKRLAGQVSICLARTMLQRYLGELLSHNTGSYGWVLDDDMRVDSRATEFLSWLPKFRAQGTDVLIGSYEGSSPNPPLNGLRVQLFDFLHNYYWLDSLPGDALLPDRSRENHKFRVKYPDYYYDLSRKHTGHLDKPYWLEPVVTGETVKCAIKRLSSGAIGMLSGAPLTRSLVVSVSDDPLESSHLSVNRGGNTLVLDPTSLTQTPNLIPQMQGRHLRRSDMIWAIVNRYYRNMTIREVGFPVYHVGRIETVPYIDFDKTRDEILGAAFYAAISEFFKPCYTHKLDFTTVQIETICDRTEFYLEQRLTTYSANLRHLVELRELIRQLPNTPEIQQLLSYLDDWFTPSNLDMILRCTDSFNKNSLHKFMSDMKYNTDNYANSNVCIKFILAQL